MIQTKYKILNWGTITILFFLFCGVQTSLWPLLTGGAPSPQFWLILLLYLVLYRSYYQALIFSYFLALIIKSFSSVSIGMLWPLFFLLITPASYFKSRMFWPNTRYFMIASFLFVGAYHVFSLILSYYLENNPVPISPFSRLLEISLTLLWSAPLYWLMNFIDKLTLPEIIDTQGARE